MFVCQAGQHRTEVDLARLVQVVRIEHTIQVRGIHGYSLVLHQLLHLSARQRARSIDVDRVEQALRGHPGVSGARSILSCPAGANELVVPGSLAKSRPYSCGQRESWPHPS